VKKKKKIAINPFMKSKKINWGKLLKLTKWLKDCMKKVMKELNFHSLKTNTISKKISLSKLLPKDF